MTTDSTRQQHNAMMAGAFANGPAASPRATGTPRVEISHAPVMDSRACPRCGGWMDWRTTDRPRSVPGGEGVSRRHIGECLSSVCGCRVERHEALTLTEAGR